MTGFNVVEICAGAGGQSWGLGRAGFEHLLAVEIDENAAKTLRYNLSKRHPDVDMDEVVRVGDVADRAVWDPDDYVGKVDLFAGGVPCPPFSIAGKQLGASDERDLFAWAVRHVAVIKPKALMLENVRGLSMPRFAAYRQRVLDELAEQGYVGFWKLLQSSDFGVPQLRPRFVLVALLREFAPYFRWPDTSQNESVTVAEALKPFMTEWPEYETWAKLADGVAPTIVGGSKKHGGADLGPTRAKRAWADMGIDAMGVANDDVHFDMTTPKLSEKLPKLTVQMVARIQGWENWDDWPILGRKTSAYRQVGNAFPPPVAEAVGRSICNALKKVGEPEPMPELDETVDHDPVYRVLKQADEPLTEKAILRLLKEAYSEGQLSRRIAYLQRDFSISLVNTPSGVAYKLGEFKGFVGQEDHERHVAFVGMGRSRIS